MVVDLAIKSVRTILSGCEVNKLGLDVKRYAKVEKIPGGLLEECEVLNGVMLNKGFTIFLNIYD
jgi:T-complex protein 1 subunit gamma